MKKKGQVKFHTYKYTLLNALNVLGLALLLPNMPIKSSHYCRCFKGKLVCTADGIFLWETQVMTQVGPPG